MDLSVESTDKRDRSLPVAGFKGAPEEIERQWYEQVYRGQGDSMARLTWRAVLIEPLLGPHVVAQSLTPSGFRGQLRDLLRSIRHLNSQVRIQAFHRAASPDQ